MQRLSTILLLGLLLFNAIGFSVVYLLEEQQRTPLLGDGFEQWYQATENVVLKIPMKDTDGRKMDDAGYRKMLGNLETDLFEVESKQLVNDTLYIHCILGLSARDHFYNLAFKISDQPSASSESPTKSGHANMLKSFLKDYMMTGRNHVFYVVEWTSDLQTTDCYYDHHIPSTNIGVATPPPELS